MELAKSKIDIMSLNSQLLDAIQQKLNLSQQLEAWQVGPRWPGTFRGTRRLTSRVCSTFYYTRHRWVKLARRRSFNEASLCCVFTNL